MSVHLRLVRAVIVHSPQGHVRVLGETAAGVGRHCITDMLKKRQRRGQGGASKSGAGVTSGSSKQPASADGPERVRVGTQLAVSVEVGLSAGSRGRNQLWSGNPGERSRAAAYPVPFR